VGNTGLEQTMKAASLVFTRPGQVEIHEKKAPRPRSGELLVKSRLSAVSAGTEALVFTGRFPEHLPVDETISSLAGTFKYPLKYGYSCAGRVKAAGSENDTEWIGRRVFAFNPHESHFTARPGELIAIPPDIGDEDAVFLAAMETAVNVVMDAGPLIGEKVVVFGQGIIGLLTAALLAGYPLATLICVDNYRLRRDAALEVGANAALSPTDEDFERRLYGALVPKPGEKAADLIIELSGNPAALNTALRCIGFGGRIVIGSWYGTKPVTLDLGGRFHRDRIRIIGSQVSTIAPELSGRWTRERRLTLAWEMIRHFRPSRFITHRVDICQAPAAYELITDRPQETLQVVLIYPEQSKSGAENLKQM